MRDFWYFGCKCEGESGHYLFTEFNPSNGTLKDDFPTYLLDGTFAPVERKPGLWRRVVIRAAHEHLTILAGWDNTVDTRPGSNAAFIAHGVLSVEEMLQRAKEIFPAQYERLCLGRTQVFEVEP